jgi:ubiquinone/menaquinone biosynthesis C-methylase UbiE
LSNKTHRERIDGEKLTRWYNAQARFYSARRDAFDGRHVRCVAGSLDRTQPLRILDAGCGTGLFTIGLAASASRWRVEGVDAANGMLEIGRRHAERKALTNASFCEGDVERLGFGDATFDAVVAAGLLPNLNSPHAALTECHRVLKPGGRLFVVEIDRDSLSALARLNFSLMVWGYRVISTVMPRFKFARGWNLEQSTLSVSEIETALQAAAFRPGAVHREIGHLIVEAFKSEESNE